MTVMTLFALAAMGCVGNVNSDSTNVGVDPDDTSDPENYVTVDVTIHASIDGEPIDPVGVCIHEATEDVGNEATLAPAEVTGKAIPVTVFQGGEAVRPWIGPATSAKTTDGHRILEFDGRKWVHPLADFQLSENGCAESETAKMPSGGGCEVTVPLNVMAAQEGVDYACVGTQGWSGSSSEPDHYEFTQRFVASEGQYFADPDERGFDGLFGTNRSFVTTGTTLKLYDTLSGNSYTLDEGSKVMENGFTVVLDDGDVVTHLTCTTP